MVKKYVVIPGNTDLNRGDQALIWESIRLFQEVDSDALFYLLENGNNQAEILEQSKQTMAMGHVLLTPILLHPGRITQKKENDAVSYSIKEYLLWGYQAIKDSIRSFVVLWSGTICNVFRVKLLNVNQNYTYNIFKECDGVIVKGGGFLHAYGRLTDSYMIYYLMYHIYLAKILGKKIFVMPNSFGPLDGVLVKWMVRKALQNCVFLSAREKVSQQFISKELGVACSLFPDLGFFTRPSKRDFSNYLTNQGVPLGKKKLVAFTLRPYRFPKSQNPKQGYINYLFSVRQFAEYLIKKDYYIVLIVHTLGPSTHEDDRIAIRDFMELCSFRVSQHVTYIEDATLNCHDLTKLYSYMDYMIGTRFHSVIFSLNSLIPSLAIAYGGNKGVGIMHDIGLPNLAIPIEDISFACLRKQFQFMEENREDIIANIQVHRLRIEDGRKVIKGLIMRGCA